MNDLSENERIVLKQLHDGLIRPSWPIATRTGLDMRDVESTLENLKAKGLV